MHARTGMALSLLAAALGYALSSLQFQAAPNPAGSLRTEAARGDQTAGVSADPRDDATPIMKAGAPEASFVHEGPNVATMSAPAALAALPPESMPLAQSAGTLAGLMRAGSREASLRLLHQLNECEEYALGKQALDLALGLDDAVRKNEGSIGTMVMITADGRDPEAQIDDMTSGAARMMVEKEQQCVDFEDVGDALRFEAQWRLALLGELEGLLRFAVEPAMELSRAIEQHDRIERYRERALSFLTQAMTQHSAQAVAQLMNAYDPGWIPWGLRPEQRERMPQAMRTMALGQFPPSSLRQVAGSNAALAYRYARLCERVCPDMQRAEAEAAIARLRDALTPEVRETAEAEARRLREQHFPDADRADWIAGLGDAPDDSKPGKP